MDRYSSLILQKLMYNPKLRFSDMQLEDLTSKHFTYYLKKLVAQTLVVKDGDFYYLTDLGKDTIGLMDEAALKKEKQPKVSVAIIVVRETAGKTEILLNKRKKQPYYGKIGGYTGKMRFGETFEDCARRELLEETGLTGNFHFARIIRKMAYKDDQTNIVQDQIMVLFRVTGPEGTLLENCKEHENFWCELEKIPELEDQYNTFAFILDTTLNTDSEPVELFVEAEGY